MSPEAVNLSHIPPRSVSHSALAELLKDLGVMPTHKSTNDGNFRLISVNLMQPEEYEKIGSYAMIGLPEELYPIR